MRLVFIFCSVAFGAQKHLHFLSQSGTDVASLSFPRPDVQTKMDRSPRQNSSGIQNGTAPPPATNFHRLTEHAQAYSLDLKVMMGPKEIQLYDEMLSKGSVYFEFGLGGSTLFAAQHSNLHHITAVDSSTSWITKVKSEAPIAAGIQRGRISIVHVDLGPVGAYGYPIHRDAAREREYSKAILGTTPAPDVVLVDGRYRVACALRTVLSAVQNGWPHLILMIHDYERQEYASNMNPLLGTPTRVQGSGKCYSCPARLLAAWELTGAKLAAMRSDGDLLGRIRDRLQQVELTPIFVTADH